MINKFHEAVRSNLSDITHEALLSVANEVVLSSNREGLMSAIKYASERLTPQGSSSYISTLNQPEREFAVGVTSTHQWASLIEGGMPSRIINSHKDVMIFYWRPEHIPATLSQYSSGSGRV